MEIHYNIVICFIICFVLMYISVIRINNFEHFSNIKLKNSTAVIAGCAKDIESYVRISTSKMTDNGNLFEDYDVCLIF